MIFYHLWRQLKNPQLQQDLKTFFKQRGINIASTRLGIELKSNDYGPDLLISLQDRDTFASKGIIHVEIKTGDMSISKNVEGVLSNICSQIPSLVRKYPANSYTSTMFYFAEGAPYNTGNQDLVLDRFFKRGFMNNADGSQPGVPRTPIRVYSHIIDHKIYKDARGNTISEGIWLRANGECVQFKFIQEQTNVDAMPFSPRHTFRSMYKIGRLQSPSTANLDNPSSMTWTSVIYDTISASNQASPTYLSFNSIPFYPRREMTNYASKYARFLFLNLRGGGNKKSLSTILTDIPSYYTDFFVAEGFPTSGELITQYGEYTGTLFSMVVNKYLLEIRRRMEGYPTKSQVFWNEDTLRTLLGKNIDLVYDSAAVLNALNGITYRGLKIPRTTDWHSISTMPGVLSPAVKFLKSLHADLKKCSRVATTISRTVADSLVGAVFFDSVLNRFNTWSKIDTSVPNYKDTPAYQARAGQYASLKAYVKDLIVHLPRVGMDMSDEARFDRLWTKMEDALDATLVTGTVFSSSNIVSVNFNNFMLAYFDFMQSFLYMTGINALHQARIPGPALRAKPFATALEQAIMIKSFSEHPNLIRFWDQGLQELIPLIQFNLLRVPVMFKIDAMHRIGNWHVVKVTSALPEGPYGPITYYMAFRADRGADINEFGVRVFTTWGTLVNKDDPSVTYPGWAMPDVSALDELFAKPSSTPPDIQARINMLNAIMTPGTNRYVPWTPFINQETDGAGHSTSSFSDLLPG